ncbi:MAG TPA: YqhA family protein [Xanthobacteraceae bacterium]|jgi:uncharacterized protein (TIGR00645 family)|nr:YqhA family protein [Xanthobacteraceae bacterium]
MRPIERGFETALFLSRWLLAPFLVGLALTLILLLLRFFADFYHIAVRLPGLTWHELIVDILNMIDIVLTANLVLIVVFSGYENFLHKVEARDHEDWPEGLTAIDFGALKQRVMGSIAVIAAVDALAWYLDLEKGADNVKLTWVAAFPLIFVVAMLLLAIADRLSRQDQRPSYPSKGDRGRDRV